MLCCPCRLLFFALLRQIPLQLALSDIVSSAYAPQQTINFLYADSNGTVLGTTAAMIRLSNAYVATSTPIVAAIGEATDTNSAALGQLATALPTPIPVVSPSLTSNTTSADTTGSYRYLMRTSTGDALLGAAMRTFIAQQGWQRFAIIHSDDDFGRGFEQQLLLLLQATNSTAAANVTVYSVPVSADDAVVYAAVSVALSALQQASNTIYVLHSSDPVPVLRYAFQLGLLSAPQAWVGTTLTCTDSMIAELADLSPNALSGVVCITDGVASDSPAWANFSTRLSASNATLYPTPASVPLQAGYLYDAMWTVAFGIHALSLTSDSNTGSALLVAMLQQSWEGVTGHMAWPALTISCPTLSCSISSLANYAGDRQTPLVYIRNFDSSSGRFVVRGTISTASSAGNVSVPSVISTLSALVWADGGTRTPKDSPNVYVAGDSLPVATDARIVVLSFAIGVFGAWTTLILLEQAISQRQQSFLEAAPRMFGLQHRKKRGLQRWVAPWMLWTAAAAASLSCGSVWPSLYIAATSLSVPAATLYFSSAALVSSLVALWLLVVVALLFSISDIQPRAAAHGTGSSMLDSSTVSTSRTLNSAVTTTGISATDSTSRSQSGNERRRRKLRQLHATLGYRLSAMLLQVGWRTGISVVILAATISAQQEICLASIEGPVSLHVSSSSRAAYLSFVAVLTAIPLIPMFHLTRSNLRFLSAFLFAALLQGCHWLASSGYSFTYSPATSWPAGAVHASETTGLILAGSALALCLLLMALNVWGLRRARRLIDRLLSQVEGQQVEARKKLDTAQAEVAELSRRMQVARKIVEGINLCRPLYRTYAIALALADVDTSTAAEADKEKKAGAAAKGEELILQAAAIGDSVSGSNSGSERAGHSTHNASLIPDALSRRRQTTNVSGVSASQSRDKTSSVESDKDDQGRATAARAAASQKSLAMLNQEEFAWIHCKKDDRQVGQLLDSLSSFPSSAQHTRLLAGCLRLPLLASHPVSFELLKDVCSRSFTPENLAMWGHLACYRQATTASVRSLLAEEIYSSFIATGARHEVNISSTMKEALHSAMERRDYAPELFDRIGQEVERLIVTNNMDAFTSSPAARTAVLYMTIVHTNNSGATTQAVVQLANAMKEAAVAQSANLSISATNRQLHQQQQQSRSSSPSLSARTSLYDSRTSPVVRSGRQPLHISTSPMPGSPMRR